MCALCVRMHEQWLSNNNAMHVQCVAIMCWRAVPREHNCVVQLAFRWNSFDAVPAAIPREQHCVVPLVFGWNSCDADPATVPRGHAERRGTPVPTVPAEQRKTLNHLFSSVSVHRSILERVPGSKSST